MPSCVLKYCTNYWKKTNKSRDGVTFHRFPQNEKRKMWIKFVQKNRREENWLPSERTTICSVHFKEKDKITTKSGLTRLIKSAVPCKSNRDERSPSTDGLSDTGSEDLKGALETPLIIQLEEQLRETKKQLKLKDQIIKENKDKVKEAYEKLKEKDETIEALYTANKTKAAEIGSLKNHNNRLRNKNSSMKLLFIKMKKKILGSQEKTGKSSTRDSDEDSTASNDVVIEETY